MIGWLADDHDPPGGAELTMQEFRAAAPEEVVSVAPDELDHLSECERAVVGNCVTYLPETARALSGKQVTRYFHDLDRHSNPQLREWLLANARCVFTSPLHRDRFPWSLEQADLIPPALNLKRFRPTRQVNRNGKREGAVCVGAFMNPGKGGHLVAEWAQGNGGVDYWGFGPYAPPETAQIHYLGQASQTDLPSILWRYERFVFLPTAVEPFGRSVVEAWAAGCELIVNRNVGALHWIREEPEKLETAATDFWQVVLA